MTPQDKALVQKTFIKVLPIAEQAAALFYGHLFEVKPTLRPLFVSDLREQGRKLIQMIGYCVGKLDAPDELLPAVRELGRRHFEYGVVDSDYEAVGTALLWTLRQGLGDAFTPAVEQAWTAAYRVLATTMKEGGHAGSA